MAVKTTDAVSQGNTTPFKERVPMAFDASERIRLAEMAGLKPECQGLLLITEIEHAARTYLRRRAIPKQLVISKREEALRDKATALRGRAGPKVAKTLSLADVEQLGGISYLRLAWISQPRNEPRLSKGEWRERTTILNRMWSNLSPAAKADKLDEIANDLKSLQDSERADWTLSYFCRSAAQSWRNYTGTSASLRHTLVNTSRDVRSVYDSKFRLFFHEVMRIIDPVEARRLTFKRLVRLIPVELRCLLK